MDRAFKVRAAPPTQQFARIAARPRSPAHAARRPPPPPQGHKAAEAAAGGALRLRVVDAEGQVVGRLASQLARVLMGKDKPTYDPSKAEGDVVVVTNAQRVAFTGRKWSDKLYRRHTGYPGGLRERTAEEAHARDPGAVLRAAVLGMLPKNTLRREMARRLRIFAGPAHPFAGHPGAAPLELPPRKLREKGPMMEIPAGYEPLNPEAHARRYGHRIAAAAARRAAAEAGAAGAP